AGCLTAIGADIRRCEDGYEIQPATQIPKHADLFCKESGSTLRFLLPVIGALGIKATFHLEGRLPQRPLSPLWEEMERMGCRLSRPSASTIFCTGKLQPGTYTIAGNVSSQFITGLLLAFELMDAPSVLNITGHIESTPYIHMTKAAMELFSPQRHTPGVIAVEGDWSNAAFFLAAASMKQAVVVTGLNEDSVQGDKAAAFWLPKLNQRCVIDASDIPDLVPILSVVAAANKGAVFTNVQRIRTKESDRVRATIAMIRSLGGQAEATNDTLTIYGTGLTGGIVSSFNDHRIAMSAAIAATVCKNDVTILGAQCVNKSYPSFWDEYARLGGKYEQYIR
ncbi:MAG: 3-phosphoshikimate 1-carboxyvinyltransferase, partial [Oscillospiraceae bacterium]|nr:3-phosphoshikimate 1-carboxyvinyltransferase [Oscillospiraceae bacterium]